MAKTSNPLDKLIQQPLGVSKLALQMYPILKGQSWQDRAASLNLLGYIHPDQEPIPPDKISDNARSMYCDLMFTIAESNIGDSDVLEMALDRWGYKPMEIENGKDYYYTGRKNPEDEHTQPESKPRTPDNERMSLVSGYDT